MIRILLTLRLIGLVLLVSCNEQGFYKKDIEDLELDRIAEQNSEILDDSYRSPDEDEFEGLEEESEDPLYDKDMNDFLEEEAGETQVIPGNQNKEDEEEIGEIEHHCGIGDHDLLASEEKDEQTEEEKEFDNWVKRSVVEEKFVCNPFNNTEDEQRDDRNGIVGVLYDGKKQKFKNYYDFVDKGVQSESAIFLNDINTPTRKFDEGFELSNGSKVTNEEGSALFEYFALNLKGNLRLRDDQEPGYYQLALISDDGSILDLNLNGEFETIVDNNRQTPTRMACANQAVYLERGQEIPFDVGYFQGPRYHIALMLMWRKVEISEIPFEKHCGKKGNSYFFDFNKVPSEPKQAFQELEDNGWEVLKSSNYTLPGKLSVNPCGSDERDQKYTCYEEELISFNTNSIDFDVEGLFEPSLSLEDENGNAIEFTYDHEQKEINFAGEYTEAEKISLNYCVEHF
ncbi:MAG: hypothetical protein ACPGJV_02130 [Bacteriovoracaceae bacterium]